ncbi:MDR family MFS transporter [Actinotalea sp. C106]|uniref:MDR family MFS transporter n=1 Tax=Actinotalea sp. C106 TaxID=2908644 RepID=UPI0027E2147E|nr:MDR family MFS transporter [Actinotalea sp. C106]
MTDAARPTPTTGADLLDRPDGGDAAPPAPPTTMGAQERLAVGLLLVSAFVVILNETTMGVALPNVMADFAIPASTAQWVTTVFLLTMAVVIPITGFVMQRLGTRATFLTAMSLFTLGTLVCALAPVFPVLLGGRVIQASGTAVMMPLLMTTVMAVTPPTARGKTMGNISVVIAVAPAMGPTFSGFVLSVLPWRGLFVIMLPIAAIALTLGALRLPALTSPRPARVDLLSILVAALAFGGLVYGLTELGESAAHGGGGAGGTAIALLPVVVGVVALGLFVWRQLRLQRRDAALLDLRTFGTRTFSVAILLMAVSMGALFGTIILLPLYAQDVLGLAPLQAGLILLPGGLLMGLAAPFVGRAFDRFGARVLVVPGTVLVSAAAWGFAMLSAASPVWMLVACHVVLSGGLAMMFTPLFTSALGSLPPHLYPHGSATIGTVQQVSGAAGTALFVTVMTIQAAALTSSGATEVEATAGGTHAAFLVGAGIMLLTIPIAFAVRAARPVPSEPSLPAAH